MTAYRNKLDGEVWTTTGKTKPDYGDMLVQLSAPTLAGGIRLLWVSEDDLAEGYEAE